MCRIVAFAGIENALSSWVEQRLGLPGFVGSMVAGALVTGALIPVRHPLARLVGGYARRLAGAPHGE